MPKFCLLIELYNEDEAEDGETTRTGWTDSTYNIFKEPELMTIREALDCLHYVEPRECSGDGRIYYGHSETCFDRYPRGAIQCGDDVTLSLVLPRGITESSARRVDRVLRKHNLMR